jgi:uncharacterized protein (UPF0332 family)
MTHNYISRLLRVTSLLLTILFFTGCAAPTRPITPIEYHNFFVKSGEFLAFCSYLISQESPQLKQVISRLYYSYFLIARAIHIGKTNLYEQIKHDVVWAQNKVDVRKKYGEDLKRLRTRYDYDPISVDESLEETKSNLRFICDNELVYTTLIEDAKSQLQKVYRHEDNPQQWVNKTNEVIEKLERDHHTFVDKLRLIQEEKRSN